MATAAEGLFAGDIFFQITAHYLRKEDRPNKLPAEISSFNKAIDMLDRVLSTIECINEHVGARERNKYTNHHKARRGTALSSRYNG